MSDEVVTSDPIPYVTTEQVPNGDRRMFLPIASTLISGASQAALFDPAMTATGRANRHLG